MGEADPDPMAGRDLRGVHGCPWTKPQRLARQQINAVVLAVQAEGLAKAPRSPSERVVLHPLTSPLSREVSTFDHAPSS
jgi:hypothetical protein